MNIRKLFKRKDPYAEGVENFLSSLLDEDVEPEIEAGQVVLAMINKKQRIGILYKIVGEEYHLNLMRKQLNVFDCAIINIVMKESIIRPLCNYVSGY